MIRLWGGLIGSKRFLVEKRAALCVNSGEITIKNSIPILINFGEMFGKVSLVVTPPLCPPA
jgi:hypothetical protein